IFTGDIPFAGVKDFRVISIVQSGKCPTRPSSDSKAWTDWGLTKGIWLLMEETWNRLPGKRPPCTKIVERLKIMIPRDKRPTLKTGMLTPQAFRQRMNVSAEMLTVERLNIILNDGSDVDDNAADVKQQPTSLHSQVDETLAGCPRSIFNIDPDKIDISHDRAGKTDINHEYKSSVNPRFILHDSQGFQHGSGGNFTKVEDFLQFRQKSDLPEKIHAIWLCIETPLMGSRPLQKGDDAVLKLAKKFNIPIIAVFTKYDLLVKQFFRQDTATSKEELFNAERKASESFSRSVKQLDSQTESLAELSIPSVKVSISYEKDSLISNLMNVTCERLQDVEEKWIARQKSSTFEGHILIDCIHRLHDDVSKVWHFSDPMGILSGVRFFSEMIGLVKPLIENQVDDQSYPRRYVNFGNAGAKILVPLLQDFDFGEATINYLFDECQQYPSTAKLLATYLINLVLILHGVFADILPSDPPRALSNTVFEVVKHHKAACKKEALRLDSEPEFSTHPERVIKRVIIERLPAD
ncbi:hypothetical protein H0H92_007556, partial [Tricholoma furcatifolium]